MMVCSIYILVACFFLVRCLCIFWLIALLSPVRQDQLFLRKSLDTQGNELFKKTISCFCDMYVLLPRLRTIVFNFDIDYSLFTFLTTALILLCFLLDDRCCSRSSRHAWTITTAFPSAKYIKNTIHR